MNTPRTYPDKTPGPNPAEAQSGRPSTAMSGQLAEAPANNRAEHGADAHSGGPALRAARRLGLVFFPAFDWGISPSHPEREERLLYTQDQLREEGLFDIPGISEHRLKLATIEDAQRAHFCPPGFESCADQPHLASAGAAITAGQLVLDKVCDKAFALTRPPGHHAMKVVQGARGFCSLNIEAMMIERLRRDYGLGRIAVVDTDCHHGDGTQDIYWHDPDTLFISLHQDGRTLYPGSGFPQELGGPSARGATINIPLPPRTGDAGFSLAVEEVVKPLLAAFQPDLVINSAGQDNHFTDPITDMCLSARGYARMVESINADIAVLEGGYAIQGALPYVNLAVILAMAGLDYSHVVEPLWREELAATSAKTLDYIRGLGEALLNLAGRPDSLEHDYTLQNGFWTRERDIYYDTDGIRESQIERLRDCPDCPGLLLVRSRTEFRPWSLCIQLHRRACETCRDQAEAHWRSALQKGERAEFADPAFDRYERSW